MAACHLEQAGLTILARNWRCREGEIDIVARDRSAVVFVEVKTRNGRGYGLPVEAVTVAKVRRLRVLATRWLAENRPPYADVRFDVVSVERQPDGAVAVTHLRDAF